MLVSDIAVTADARNLCKVAFIGRNGDRLHHRLMAVAARFLGHLPVTLGYLDRFVERVGREIVGVPKAVRGLCIVFANEVMRRMTIVARSDSMMARFLPAVVLLVHYVTVCTRARIVAQVGISFCINERVHSDARGQSDRNTYDREF